MPEKDFITKEELIFLFSKVEQHCGEIIFNKGSVTESSFENWESKYISEQFSSKLKTNPFNFKKNALTDLRGDGILRLYQADTSFNNNISLKLLSLFVLYLENKINDVEEKIKKNIHPWIILRDIYKEEMAGKHLGEYLFYFWREKNFSVFQINFITDPESGKWTGIEGDITCYEKNGDKYVQKKLNAAISFGKKEKAAGKENISVIDIAYDITELRILILNRDHVENGQLCMATYSGIDGDGNIVVGTGLLEKQENVKKIITEILSAGRINNKIYNLIYQTRQKITTEDFSSGYIKDLPNFTEVDNIRSIKGYWKVLYMRNDKPANKNEDEDKGGLELNLLRIDENGSLELYCEDDISKVFSGFLFFPFGKGKKLEERNNTKLVKGNLEFFSNHRIYKLHLFLKLYDENLMGGIYSGWNEEGTPFSSLIRLERINDGIEKKPDLEIGFIPKEKIPGHREVTEELINFLHNNKKFLDLAQDCLPPRKIGNPSAGKYYLLYYDHEHGNRGKAKLILDEQNGFTVIYPDAKYSGVFQELEMEGDIYLYLDIKYKHTKKGKKNYVGNYLFPIGKSNNPQSEPVKYLLLTGLSLRRNLTGSLQVKKEFLVSPIDESIFGSEIADKYDYHKPGYFNNVYFGIEDNEEVLERQKKLEQALSGRESNLIFVTDKSINNYYQNIRNYDYGNVFLTIFLSDIISFDQTSDERYSSFIDSILHGLIKPDFTRDKIQKLLPAIDKKQEADELVGLLLEAEQIVVSRIKDKSIETLFSSIKKADRSTNKLVIKIDEFADKFRKCKNQ